LDIGELEEMNFKSYKEQEQNRMYNKLMEEAGFKPRRKKAYHQWWESPWIDYDNPRTSYYERK